MRLSLLKHTFFTAFMLGIFLPVLAYAQGTIMLAELEGEVTFYNENGQATFAVGDLVPVGTEVTTGGDGSVTFVFSNASTIVVSRHSFLTLTHFQQSGPPNFHRNRSEAEEGTSETNIRLDYGGVLSSVRSLNLESGSSFTVDTPVGSAGVRGTNFFVGVDPATGASSIYVMSGIVQTNRNNTSDPNSGSDSDTDPESDSNSVLLYPSQQINFSENRNEPPNVQFLDLSDFLQNVDQSIIEALLRNKHAIDEENEAYMDSLRNQLNDPPSPEDEETLERLQTNLDNLINNIIRGSIVNNIISEDRVRELIDQLNEDASRKIDFDSLSRPENEGLTPQDEERLKRMRELEEQRYKQQEEQRRRQEELKKQNEELLNRLKEQQERLRQEQEEAKQRAREAAIKAMQEKMEAEQRRQLEERLRQQEEMKKRAEEESERLLRERQEREKEKQENAPPANTNDMFIPQTPPVS